MKTLIKVVIAGLVLFATWHAGTAYFRYYKFKDAVQQTALFGLQKSDGELQARVIQLGREAGVPLAAESVSVLRTENHILINAAYTERIQLAPTYFYPHEFKMNVDVLTLGATVQPSPVR